MQHVHREWRGLQERLNARAVTAGLQLLAHPGQSSKAWCRWMNDLLDAGCVDRAEYDRAFGLMDATDRLDAAPN